jgi:parvulin-like peptidyl-prolyl isomerase
MLGFFRKYEKTFFLVVFAPAVLSLGISGVMVASIQGLATPTEDYRIFSEEIDQGELALGNSRERLDVTLTRYAWDQKSGQARVQVSDKELSEYIKSSVARALIPDRTQTALAARGLTPGSDKYRQAWFSEYIKQMSNKDLTKAEYAKFLKDRGDKAEIFEERVRNSLRGNRLISAAEDLSYITPKQLWDAYQEKYHRRSFETVSIYGKDNIPTKDTLSDDEIKSHWKKNFGDYIEPRKARLHYLIYPFKDAKKGLKAPTADELKAFYAANPGFYNDRAGKTKAFESVIAQIKSDVMTDRLHEKIFSVMDKASAKINSTMQAADMAPIASSTVLSYGVTAVMNLKDLQQKHKEIAGEPFSVWFNKSVTHRPSSPLLGEEAAYIFWLRNTVSQKFPQFEEVKEKVANDYVNLPERELKKYYESNRTKFRTDQRFVVETLVIRYKRLLKKMKAPPDSELKEWFEGHKSNFKGKKLEDVKDAVISAWKLEKAKKQADEMVAKIEQKIAGLKRKNKSVVLEDFAVDKEIPNYRKMDIEERTLSRKEMRENDILKGASTQVASQKIGRASRVQNLSDNAGKFMFLVSERLASKIPEFKDVKTKVREEIVSSRGYERAKDHADKLLKELEGLSGEALAKALKARKLVSKRSPSFSKTDTTVEGYKDAGRYITEAYNLAPEGAYGAKIMNDDDNRIDLLRCVEKEAAPDDEFSAKRAELRKEALSTVSRALRDRWSRRLEQAARSISDSHMSYAINLYNGKQDITKVKLRQLVFKPKQAILDKWLKKAALEKLESIQKELAEGEEFGKVALIRSEDSYSRANNGILGDKKRGDLINEYGGKFEEKVFSLQEGKLSRPIFSKLGVHLVKVLRKNLPGGRCRIAHIMVKSSAELREPPQRVIDEARAKTREKVQKIAARLKVESFARILQDYEKEEDVISYERGVDLELDYMSPFQIKTVDITIQEIPEPFELDGVWHLVIVADDSGNLGRASNSENLRNLAHYHVGFSIKKYGEQARTKAFAVRKQLIEFQQNYQNAGVKTEAPWGQVVDEIQKLCRDNSDLPTKEKGGVLGSFKVDKRVIPYGKGWMQKVFELASREKEADRVSGVFESEYGFHIIEVVDVTRPKPVDIDPYGDFEASVVRNCDWK